MELRILIAFGHRIVAEALARLLQQDLAGTVGFTSAELSSSPSDPDLVLLDPGCCQPEFFTRYPRARFLLVDPGLPEEDISFLLLSHPLAGVLAPDLAPDLLPKAVKAVSEGQIWLTQKNLRSLLSSGSLHGEGPGWRRLSPAERRVAELMAQGYRNREIANALFLSEQTVKAHASRIFRKLNISSRTQLVRQTLNGARGPVAASPPRPD